MLAFDKVRDEVYKAEYVVPVINLFDVDVNDVSKGRRHKVLDLLNLRRWIRLSNQDHSLDIKGLDADDEGFGLKTNRCNHYVDHKRSPG